MVVLSLAPLGCYNGKLRNNAAIRPCPLLCNSPPRQIKGTKCIVSLYSSETESLSLGYGRHVTFGGTSMELANRGV
jgi:hypothetical protein